LLAFSGFKANFPDNLSSFTSLPSSAFITVDNGTDTLEYFLTSAAYSVPSAGEEELDGSGYFTVTADIGGSVIDTATIGSFDLTTDGDTLESFMATSTISAVTSAPTPEPTSLILLGTGLLSAAGIARRKFASKLELLTGKLQLDGLRPSDLLFCEGFRMKPSQQFLLRIASTLVAAIGLILFLPLLPFVVLMVRLSSPGPVIFRQERVGLNGKIFNV